MTIQTSNAIQLKRSGAKSGSIKGASIEERVTHARMPFESKRVMPVSQLREKLLKPEQKAILKNRHMLIEAAIWLSIASALIVMVVK